MSTHAAPKPERAKDVASSTTTSAADAINTKRAQAADAIDDAAERLGEQGKRAPKPLDQYAEVAQNKLNTAADYVRDHDARQMGQDVLEVAREFPVASLTICAAVVVGGGILVGAMLRNPESGGAQHLASGLGPKATDTLSKMRDAAFSLVLAKAVATVEEMFPGFREHFENA
jgi:hypothetical protein